MEYLENLIVFGELVEAITESPSQKALEKIGPIAKRLVEESKLEDRLIREAIEHAGVEVVEVEAQLDVDRFRGLGWTWRKGAVEGDLFDSERAAVEDAYQFLQLEFKLERCDFCRCGMHIDCAVEGNVDGLYCSLNCANADEVRS